MSFRVCKKQRQIQNHTKYNKQGKYGYDFNKQTMASKITEFTGDSHTNHRPVIETSIGLPLSKQCRVNTFLLQKYKGTKLNLINLQTTRITRSLCA